MLGGQLLVHPSVVNPMMYSVATLHGHGLREDDLAKAFSRLISRKLSQREPVKWPLEADERLILLDTHNRPLSCIHNAICW